MSSGSDRTLELLNTLEPLTQWQAVNFVVAARNAGIPLVIISARRSYEANRDVGGSDRSYHLSGHAFDVEVLGYTRDEIPGEWWQAVGAWAESSLGLFWGGRFLHGGVPDVNHFDSRRQLTSV